MNIKEWIEPNEWEETINTTAKITTILFLLLLSFLLFLIFTITFNFILAYINYQRKKNHFINQKMVTFPAFTPISMFSPTGMENMIDLLTKNNKVEEVVMAGAHFDGNPSLIVTHPDLLKSVMVEENFAKYPLGYEPVKALLGDGLVTSKGDLWKRQRRLLTPIFHFHKLKLMAPIMERNIKNWIQKIKEKKGREEDPVQLFCDLALRVIIESAFGGLEAPGSLDPDQLIPIWHSISNLFSGYFLTVLLLGQRIAMAVPFPWIISFRWKIRKLRTIIKKSIELKRKNPINGNIDQSDLLFEMINVRDEAGKPIDETLIIDEALTFLFAGHETTSNTLAWTCYFLTRNKRVFDKLREEVDRILPAGENSDDISIFEYLPKLQYCKAVIFETLRLRPPTPFLDRIANRDCNLGDYDVPKGTLVTLGLIGAHLNPEYFENPFEYNPDRFLTVEEGKRHAFSFVPFSGGSRNCVGQKFAMQEAISALALVVKHFDIEADLNERVYNSFKVTSTPIGFHCRFIDRFQ